MALIEEFERTGSWLFRWRSFLPLVLYGLSGLVIIAGLDRQMDHTASWWIGICLGISLLGQTIRALTIAYTPKDTSGRNTRAGQVAAELNTSGMYSVCRHPLYLGNFFMWLGIMLYTGSGWLSLVFVLLFWLYYERIMFAEEAFLRKKFGPSYLRWSEQVPPFLPRPGRWKPASSRFSLRNVLKREYNGFFAIFVSFALIDVLKNAMDQRAWSPTLIQPFWMYGLLGAFVVFLTLRTLKKRSRLLHVEGR